MLALPRFVGRLALISVAAWGLCSCDQLFDKGSKQNIETADKKVKAGEYQPALKLYEAALDGTSKTADVHYKLALLYADKLNSPLDAMHHFARYLALAPTGAHAREAKDFRREGEQKVIATLTKNGPISQEEASRLKNTNNDLRIALTTLKAQRAATPVPLPAGVKRGEQAQKPVPSGGRTHVVASKETLGSIAQKYYKNKARWKEIQDANFYPMEGTAKIRPGMTLYVP